LHINFALYVKPFFPSVCPTYSTLVFFVANQTKKNLLLLFLEIHLSQVCLINPQQFHSPTHHELKFLHHIQLKIRFFMFCSIFLQFFITIIFSPMATFLPKSCTCKCFLLNSIFY
jgi:hypothetical protein